MKAGLVVCKKERQSLATLAVESFHLFTLATATINLPEMWKQWSDTTLIVIITLHFANFLVEKVKCESVFQVGRPCAPLSHLGKD